MSFGFGVGDFLTLGAKAWDVYMSCKDAPKSFKNISDEVLSLHAVLKESEEVLNVQTLSPEQQGRLSIVINGCNGVLTDLQHTVDRYGSLGLQSKRTWDRLGWGQQPIAEMRSRLTSNTVLLSAFVNISQLVVEKRLKSILRDLQDGHREGSVISSKTLCTEDADTWRDIMGELEEAGITAAAFDLNRHFIIDWLKKNLVDVESDITIWENDHGVIDEIPTATKGVHMSSPEACIVSGVSGTLHELTIEIGNTHKLVKPKRLKDNKHRWTFFLRPSRTDTFDKVIIYLHPTFEPRVLKFTSPPYEVTRLGWGYFTIEAQILLKPGMRWMSQRAVPTEGHWSPVLTWELNFDGRGKGTTISLQFQKDNV